jgi:N-acetylglucosaminyldiphosphoundecaprenol N-acetyl-beta-D-mannosaminyltransferase
MATIRSKEEHQLEHAESIGQSTRGDLIHAMDRLYSLEGIRRRKRQEAWHSRYWLLLTRLSALVARTVDLVLASALLVLLSPLLALTFVYVRSKGGGVRKQIRLGRWATSIGRLSFHVPNQKVPFANLPVLFNIAAGEMSFIGPRTVPYDESEFFERQSWRRYDVRPGLLSPWWLKQRANISYTTEALVEADYVDSHSLKGDVGLALRALPALLFSNSGSDAPETVKLLGISFNNLTMSEALAQILDFARERRTTRISFVNADCVNIAVRNRCYWSVLERSDIVLADGIGIRLAGQILNRHIRQNVNGTDLMLPLCAAMEEAGYGLFLLGAQPGVAENARTRLNGHHPRLRIDTQHGYFDPEDTDRIIEQIRASGARILMVALGAPKQELWIDTHLDQLPGIVAIGVGGLLDFYSGRINRAPIWMRELGLEWLYRFTQEPRRMWKRYFLGNIVFLGRVIYDYRRSARKDDGGGTR